MHGEKLMKYAVFICNEGVDLARTSDVCRSLAELNLGRSGDLWSLVGIFDDVEQAEECAGNLYIVHPFVEC